MQIKSFEFSGLHEIPVTSEGIDLRGYTVYCKLSDGTTYSMKSTVQFRVGDEWVNNSNIELDEDEINSNLYGAVLTQMRSEGIIDFDEWTYWINKRREALEND